MGNCNLSNGPGSALSGTYIILEIKRPSNKHSDGTCGQ